MVIKTRLTKLPDIESLRKLSQSLAMLEAIISPRWEHRYYSFNSKWREHEMMASMRNGSGDDYFILFNRNGAIIKGFAHESPMSPYANELGRSWRGVLDDVPSEFQSLLLEPAFSAQDSTFCIWRRYTDSSWQTGRIDYPDGDDADGSEDLLSILDGSPATYKAFAEFYYERGIALSTVEHIYKHKSLTDEIVIALNARISLKDLEADVAKIGYPNAAQR